MAHTKNDDDLNPGLVEETSSYTFRQLIDQLYMEQDLILTVPKEQEASLKQGLIIRKSKDNKRSKSLGLLAHEGTLTFKSYPAKDEAGNDSNKLVCVRITLSERKSINVVKMEVPTNDL